MITVTETASKQMQKLLASLSLRVQGHPTDR